MSIPSQVTGAGNNDTQNVFKILFTRALSSAPTYEAYDNSDTFPAVDPEGSTTDKEIFTGTTGNDNKPMLSLVDTTDESPGENWMPASASVGSANPNRLKGQVNYVTSPVTPAASGEILFNMVGEFPSDASVPSTSSMNYLLQIRYTYTGDAPGLEYYFNSGTEGTPSWTSWTPSSHGMRHTNSGASVDNYKLTLPAVGVVETGEIWIVAS